MVGLYHALSGILFRIVLWFLCADKDTYVSSMLIEKWQRRSYATIQGFAGCKPDWPTHSSHRFS